MVTTGQGCDPLLLPRYRDQRGELLIDRAIHLLQNQGVTVSSPDAIDLFESNGAIKSQSDELICLQGRVLRRMLDNLPRAFNLYDRHGRKSATLVGGNEGRHQQILQACCTTGNGYNGAANDAEPGRIGSEPGGPDRDCFNLTTARTGKSSREVALDDLVGVFRGFVASDKPVIKRLSSPVALDGLRALLCEITGSMQMLENKPPIVFETFSPALLHWNTGICRVIIDSARMGIPLALAASLPEELISPSDRVDMPLMLKRAVESAATNLAGMLIHQYAMNRAPLIWAVPCFPENDSGSWEQVQDLLMAAGESLALPVSVTYPDIEAEAAMFTQSGSLAAMASAFSGAQLVCWGGVSESGRFEEQQFQADIKAAEMIRTLCEQSGRHTGTDQGGNALPMDDEVRQSLRLIVKREAARWNIEF